MTTSDSSRGCSKYKGMACQSPTIQASNVSIKWRITGAGWCVHEKKKQSAQPPHKKWNGKVCGGGYHPRHRTLCCWLLPGHLFAMMGCRRHNVAPQGYHMSYKFRVHTWKSPFPESTGGGEVVVKTAWLRSDDWLASEPGCVT